MKFYKTPSFEDAYTTSHFLERLLIEASSSLFLKRFCLLGIRSNVLQQLDLHFIDSYLSPQPRKARKNSNCLPKSVVGLNRKFTCNVSIGYHRQSVTTKRLHETEDTTLAILPLMLIHRALQQKKMKARICPSGYLLCL